MAYYDQYYTQYPQVQTPLIDPETARRANAVVRRRMMFILGCVVLVIVPLLVSLRPKVEATTTAATESITSATINTASQTDESTQLGPVSATSGALSPVFTPQVRHWEPQIVAWASAYGLDPNLVAIIMQIESCGDPAAISSAGAQGLFQVMPFHFQPGESTLDPETNARRGLAYFVERLQQTNGDIGRAFAGYNGGHGAAGSSWDHWLPETQRYYVWSTGIYNDIQSGSTESPTIQKWLAAGGASLCRQAAARLGL